jgi:hypothetical protein
MDVYDELQDVLRGPVIHISQAPKVKALRARLNELRDAADKRWGKSLNWKMGPANV